jgi:hypothetical protein
MKLYLTKDEWYPVYGLSEENKPYLNQQIVDVTPEVFEAWKKLEEEFDTFQNMLHKLPKTSIKATENLW